MKGSRPMSNDPCLNVKVFCNVCDGVYQMSGLRKHIAHRHKMTKSAYIAGFGDIRKQIISLVYHACGICKKTMLLDTDIISKHTTKTHRIGYTAYAIKHMKKNSGLIKKDKNPAAKIAKKKPEAGTPAPQKYDDKFWKNILFKKNSVSPTNSSSPSSSKSQAPASSNLVSKPLTKVAPKTPAKRPSPSDKTPAKRSSPSKTVGKSPVTETPRPATRLSSRKSIPSPKPASSSPVLPPTPPATPPTPPIIKGEPVVKKEKEDVSMTKINSPSSAKNQLVVIQCDICFKTFSKNIQLRAHTRKNHS